MTGTGWSILNKKKKDSQKLNLPGENKFHRILQGETKSKHQLQLEINKGDQNIFYSSILFDSLQ